LKPLEELARAVRKGMRTESGGYRRDHLRALVAASGAKTAGFARPNLVTKWRAGQNKTANTYIIEIAM
jgi:hypothetical protein